ncbi:MAG: DNA polymerase I, partial [Deltaproteobacteria bacterium]
IPGVRGVGPKTAAALIQHFGSLERVLEAPEEIEGLGIRGAASVRAKIESGREDAVISKRLATIRTDVPLDVKLADLAFRSPHTTELLEIAEELEMGRLARRLRDLFGIEEEPEPKAPPRGEGDAETGFGSDVSGLEGADVAFVVHDEEDGETCCLAAAAGDTRVLLRGEAKVARALSRLVRKRTALSGFDLKALCRRFGIAPGHGGIDLGVASYLCDPSIGGHGREEVLRRFLGEAPAGTGGGAAEAMAVALEQVQRLIPAVRGELEKREQVALYRSIEHPLIGILARIEARGILLDVDLLARLAADFDQRMAALVEKIYAAAGTEFNILSPIQLREVLFDRLGLPTKGLKKTKTGPSTDSDSLQALAPLHPLPALVLEYRGLAKLKSTYVDALPRLVDEEGRIHTTLNQTVTATGRLSSSDPNLQNIPVRSEDGAKIRRAFIAPPGYELVSADYNQIELRVLAHLSGDDALRETFRSGRDIHASTAAEVFGVPESEVTPSMRRAAKVINFGIIYGMGATRMSRDLGISRKEAADYIERYFARYPGVRRFYADTLAAARRDGYVST